MRQSPIITYLRIESCWGFAWGIYSACVAVYLRVFLKVPVETIFLLTSFGYLLIVLLEVPSGFLADRYGAKQVVSAAFVLTATAAMVYALPSTLAATRDRAIPLVISAEILLACGWSLYSRALESWAINSMNKHERERTLALAARRQVVGLMCGGTISLAIMLYFGSVLFVWLLMAGSVALCFLFWLYAPEICNPQSGSHPVRWREWLAALLSLSREFWVIATLFAVFSIGAFLLTYYVPMIANMVQREVLQNDEPWVPLLFFAVVGAPALMGSVFAVNAAVKKHSRVNRLFIGLFAASAGMILAGVAMHPQVGFGRLSGLRLEILLTVLLLARIGFPIAAPILNTMLHDEVNDDSIRTFALSVVEMMKGVVLLLALSGYYFATILAMPELESTVQMSRWWLFIGILVAVVGTICILLIKRALQPRSNDA